MGGIASASEDEGDRGAVVTSVEHYETTAVSVGGGRDTKTHGDVPESRKHAVSKDTIVEREAKQALSLRPSEASSTLRPLLQMWWSTPVGWEDVTIPLHLRGQRACATPNRKMPR